ncbi:MAG: MarR family transcriptional regulator, partial [Candidatus Dadabacteria bacterium]
MVDIYGPNDEIASLDLALEAMYYGYQRMTAEPDARLRELGLARVHHRIVYFLARTPDCSVGGLINRMRVTKQYLNAPLRR